ncbi:MAG: metallophosphoesterase [Pseudomonadota bacterium]
MLTRRRVLRAFLAVSGLSALLGAYASWVEPAQSLRVKRWRIAPSGWPRDLRLKIAVLADLHAGAPYVGPDRVSEIVAQINALQPDLIALLGDYQGNEKPWRVPMAPEMVARSLASLRAPLGVHGVLGNHDWAQDPGALQRGTTDVQAAFMAAGQPLMENGAVKLSKDGRSFWLAGLGDQLAHQHLAPALRPAGRLGRDDMAGTLAQITDDAPAILLAHEPDIFAKGTERFALTLSGHTHGGQVRLGGYSPIVPSRYGNRYAYGHVVEDGRDLVVSGGIGCSIIPIRLGVPPEITLIELE